MPAAPTTLRKLLVFAAITAMFAAIGACSSVEGTTPTCTPNVDGGGIHATADGCEKFAVCDKDPNDPTKCCVDAMGMPVPDYAICLFGYGAAPPPGGTGGGGGTSTSTGTGTGGSGTGGTGGG